MHAAALLGAWSDYLRDILRLAKTTRHTYTSNMRAFSRWLGPEATVADITTHAIRRFCTEFEKSHRPRTLRTTLHSLRSFCAYLVVEGWFLDNPAKGVKLPKLDVSSRQTPTIEEVIALVAAADKFGDPLRAALSRAVVMTLVHGGLRRSELLSLHLRDVNLAEGSILVRHGKGDKSRVVYPHEECMAAIREYLQLRFADARHPFLFCQDRSRRLGDMGLRQMLRDVMAIAGYKDSRALLPHSLRHAYATRLLRAGANLEDIKTTLGHTSISTTELYLHTDVERLRAIRHLSALQSASPPAPPAPPAPTQPEPVQPARPRRIDLRDRRLPR